MNANSFFVLVAFLIMIFIFINELKNISIFIFKYNSIKDIANINTGQMCNNVYCEAETSRFQLANNVYDLVLPNDIYNAKTYTIFVLLYAIILFIYAFQLLISLLCDKNINLAYSKFFIVFVIFLLISFFIMNLVFRYTPYDEKGYLNYFNMPKNNNDSKLSSTILNIAIIPVITGSILLYFLVNYFYKKYNNDEEFKIFNTFSFLFTLLYFTYALYFLFNMINIVETFKDNKKPYNVYEKDDTLWTADISYASENNYYYKYFNLKDKDVPYSIFALLGLQGSSRHNNFTYEVYELYSPNFIYHVIALLALFVIVLIIVCVNYIYSSFVEKNDEILEKIIRNEKIVSLIPLFILIILLIYILNFTSFNTTFNKFVLYGATSSSYKRNLNQLNNVVVPFIALNDHNSYQDGYLNHHIILNVLISYLINFDEKNIILENYKTFPFLLNNNITLKFEQKIDINEFKNNYKIAFNKVLLPNEKHTIDEINIDINKYKFKDHDFTNNKSINVLKYLIYKSHDIIKKIKKPVLEKSDSLMLNLDNNLDINFKYSSSNGYIHNFIITKKAGYVFDDINDENLSNLITDLKIVVTQQEQINEILVIFIDHMISIQNDIQAMNKTDLATENKIKIYNENILTSLKMLSETDIIYPDKEIIIKKRFNLKQLYTNIIIKNALFNVVKSSNYLKNSIENMYYQINNKNSELTLYQAKQNNNMKITKSVDVNSYKKQINSIGPINQGINVLENILHKANTTSRETFFYTYITNIIILIILFYFGLLKT